MKRKTFIKKLMGAGVPRNTAASIAAWVQGSYYGYKEQLPAYLRRLAYGGMLPHERAAYNAINRTMTGGWDA